MIWIGFDAGGTFTDLVSVDLGSGAVTAAKVQSSAAEPAAAALAGIRKVLTLGGHAPADVARIVHGTTIATNALIESKGARVGFVCNRGFRDVVEIGRMFRSELFDIDFTKTAPLVPRNLREEVDVRDAASGVSLVALDDDSVRRAARRLVAQEVNAVAVGLLHSYMEPANELRVREILLEEAPDLLVSLSHEVSREYGEFERWTTAVVNAFLAPRISSYLGELDAGLRAMGIAAPVEIMQSNGGLASVEVASKLPVRLLESGPAGGVAGIAQFSEQLGLKHVITLDVGGTSTDVSVILDGRPTVATERVVGGHPVRAIMADIHSIGAGGGSIAYVDMSGSLHVGPRSAGADPGPVCVGKGGTAPTVTDADVVLGYLNPTRYCAGEGQGLDRTAAVTAITTAIGEPTQTTMQQAALGILAVAVRSMVSAIRSITTQRGLDPRDFVLVACGGAGPVHAGLVAEELHIPRVMIPNYPALLSARGMLLADYRTDLSLSHPTLLSAVDGKKLTGLFEDLEASGAAYLPSSSDELAIERIVEVCYDGQQASVPLTLPAGTVDDRTVSEISSRLDGWFNDRYGFVPKSNTVKVVNLRSFLRRQSDTTSRLREMEMKESSRVAVPSQSTRHMIFRDFPQGVDTAVYDRAQMSPHQLVEGPCVIEEDFSTTVVYPGHRAYSDDHGNLFILTGESQ